MKESQIQSFSLFRFCVGELCTITCITNNAPLTSVLKILSDPIINQTIGSSVQINRSLQLCFRISCFFISLPPNQYKITKIWNFRQTLHTKSGNSTLTIYCWIEVGLKIMCCYLLLIWDVGKLTILCSYLLLIWDVGMNYNSYLLLMR